MASTTRRQVITAACLAFLGLSPILAGCVPGTDPNQTDPQTGLAPKITVQDAHALIQQMEGDPNLVIMDVRLEYEFNSGHIEDAVSKCLLCTQTFQQDIEAYDKNKTYIVYDSNGVRSTRATNDMVNAGFKDVRNMYQGFPAWVAAGYPSVQ